MEQKKEIRHEIVNCSSRVDAFSNIIDKNNCIIIGLE